MSRSGRVRSNTYVHVQNTAGGIRPATPAHLWGATTCSHYGCTSTPPLTSLCTLSSMLLSHNAPRPGGRPHATGASARPTRRTTTTTTGPPVAAPRTSTTAWGSGTSPAGREFKLHALLADKPSTPTSTPGVAAALSASVRDCGTRGLATKCTRLDPTPAENP